jgi:hypothetical protein
MAASSQSKPTDKRAAFMIQRLHASLAPRGDRRPRALISSSRTIEARIDAVFAFLSDRHSHQRLTSAKLELLGMKGIGDIGWQARMRIRGPLGLRRLAAAQTDIAEQPTLIEGTVRVGARTNVRVRWELYRIAREQTVVVLGASVRSLGAVDWVLLHIGGRRWVRNLFITTLELLASELEPSRVVELSRRRQPVSRPAA